MNKSEGQSQEPVGGIDAEQAAADWQKGNEKYMPDEQSESMLYDSFMAGVEWASLPSSSVTGEEGWKEEFIEWLKNNMKLFNGSLPKSSIIADHVERYIVKATHVTGESEAIEKAIIEELQSILSSGVHPEYLPEKINDRIAELKGDKSYT